MRRWLTVFLLFLLPLQLSWAVAATYCAHETDAAASHIGHHAHRHEAPRGADGTGADAGAGLAAKSAEPSQAGKAGESGESGTSADKALTCVDDDCGFCHLGHSQPVASTPIVLPAVTGPAVEAAVPDAWSSRGPDRRDRPNW